MCVALTCNDISGISNMNNDIKIISFDLDGVLFDGPSAAFPLAQHLGLGQKFMEVYTRVAIEKKELEPSIREGSKIWKGIAADETYDHLILDMPLMLGAEETLQKLKERGYIIGCISSGVSQFFMKPFTRRLKLDFAYSNILGERNGVHDGTVKYVMGGPQKAETALQIAQRRGLDGKNLASIGDGTNDIDLFKVSGFSIAFNPENDAVSGAASVTLHSKDLRSVLEFF
ncbi:HAD family hydrolase [Candidatus Thorarchaeota archaeon]|nr:MAG: HAD family hydrolase [Candidatus Thorarchaeota archaeon]